MAQKSCFAINSISVRKRMLIVGSTRFDANQQTDFLRRRGYEVDCASRGDVAISMTRTHSYDVVVLALDCDSPRIAELAARIQKLNPNALVTCLADCKKALPPLPAHRMLWKGEPLEYFLARVEALAATA
jgi:CheY-like chemotaxis protein